jgi:hypothetical protein
LCHFFQHNHHLSHLLRFKNFVRMEVRLLHSQPFTNRHIYFLSIVELVTSEVLLSCPESLPWLVLCWHSSWIWWVNQCNHDHGCILCCVDIHPGYAG